MLGSKLNLAEILNRSAFHKALDASGLKLIEWLIATAYR